MVDQNARPLTGPDRTTPSPFAPAPQDLCQNPVLVNEAMAHSQTVGRPLTTWPRRRDAVVQQVADEVGEEHGVAVHDGGFGGGGDGDAAFVRFPGEVGRDARRGLFQGYGFLCSSPWSVVASRSSESMSCSLWWAASMRRCRIHGMSPGSGSASPISAAARWRCRFSPESLRAVAVVRPSGRTPTRSSPPGAAVLRTGWWDGPVRETTDHVPTSALRGHARPPPGPAAHSGQVLLLLRLAPPTEALHALRPLRHRVRQPKGSSARSTSFSERLDLQVPPSDAGDIPQPLVHAVVLALDVLHDFAAAGDDRLRGGDDVAGHVGVRQGPGSPPAEADAQGRPGPGPDLLVAPSGRDAGSMRCGRRALRAEWGRTCSHRGGPLGSRVPGDGTE